MHVLEKDSHPRFHIGESLLPQSVPMLRKLGVLPDIEKIGIIKYGADMVSHYHGRSSMFYFAKAIDSSQPYAFEVKRSEFDAILLKNAVAKGADLHEGLKAQRVEFRPGSSSIVHAEDRAGHPVAWDAKFVVDASGRDTFLSAQLGGKHRSRHPQQRGNLRTLRRGRTAARQGRRQYHGRLARPRLVLADSLQRRHHQRGCRLLARTIFESRQVPLDQFLLDTLRRCPPIAERMKQAKPLTEIYAAANFSYRRDTMSGDGYLMVGDAFAFIDPVFSSGVHLALNSGIMGAKVVDAYLRKSPEYAARLQEFERMVRRGIKTFSWFIHRFNQPAFQSLFVSTNRPPKIERAVLSLLAGDVFAQSQARIPLFCFKVVYYVVFVLNWKENWAVARRRKQGHQNDRHRSQRLRRQPRNLAELARGTPACGPSQTQRSYAAVITRRNRRCAPA